MSIAFLPLIERADYPVVYRICEGRIAKDYDAWVRERDLSRHHNRVIGETVRGIRIRPNEILPFCKVHRCQPDGQALDRMAYEKGMEVERAS